jgi:hypothetical protein
VTDGHYPIVCVDLHPIDGLYAIHAMVVVDMSEQEVVVARSSPGGTPASYLCLHRGLGKATQPRDACGALAPQSGEKPVENDNSRPEP